MHKAPSVNANKGEKSLTQALKTLKLKILSLITNLEFKHRIFCLVHEPESQMAAGSCAHLLLWGLNRGCAGIYHLVLLMQKRLSRLPSSTHGRSNCAPNPDQGRC